MVGKKGDWTIYRTYNLEVMAFGSDLKIVDIDVQLHRYCKIQKKKAWLREQLRNIQEKHQRADFCQQKTVAGLRRRLNDLENIKRALLS